MEELSGTPSVPGVEGAAKHTFGVLDLETKNYIDWCDTREEAEASARNFAELNPEVVNLIVVTEFDENGLLL